MLHRGAVPCLLVLLALFTFSACDFFEDKPPSWSEAQIQPERGVDGIEIRMSPMEVANALGIIDRYGRTASVESVTDDSEFYFDEIQKESYRRSLRFWWEDSYSGTSDFYVDQIDGITIDSYFEGKDINGIGIGSSKENVESAYGRYDGYFHNSGDGYIAYCRGRNVIGFGFRRNIVNRIDVSNFNPYYQWHAECVG